MNFVRDIDCVIEHTEQVLPGVVKIAFISPEIASAALPGQFVQIEPSPGVFPLTRRPITINRLTDQGFELVFDIVGRGTLLMAGMEAGSVVRVLGPLGNGWNIDREAKWLLIGGGLGAAGFQFLIDSVDRSTVLIGASGSDRVISLEGSVIATEDSSLGKPGLITALLTDEIYRDADSIAICGPVGMMEAVWNTIPDKHRGKVQVSTESRMGCGWGVCDGCSIPVSHGGFKKCCKDGPVFPGIEIDWERWKEAGL